MIAAFGGNNTKGTIDVATAVNAYGGPHGRLDFESETFVAAPISVSEMQSLHDGLCADRIERCLRMPAPERRMRMDGVQSSAMAEPHCFDARQSDVIQYGDKTGPLDTDGYTHAIAFSHANAGVPPAVTVALRGREGGGVAEMGGQQATALRASQGGGDKPHVLTSAVRRLTPGECETLQGYWRGYTAITYRGKPAADGPRYKALGNSMAVPVMRWILRRIEQVDRGS